MVKMNFIKPDYLFYLVITTVTTFEHYRIKKNKTK